MDTYVVWYHQDVLRILFTIGPSFIVLLGYSIARDIISGVGSDATPQDGLLAKPS